MREKEPKLLITFHTTAGAMAMEKQCKQDGLPGRLIPVPRSITSDCGMAWCAPPEARDVLESLMQRESLDTAGVYELLL
ncbi:MAG: DUF3343 domain-containing protein [Oscillibacter sp.]|nr:DUF3343 domain-containing protein [Oscillibacter sp.]